MGFDELDVVVRVADTGRGIAPEQLERVFEPFFSTRDAGSGLGLSIARQVAIAHGGAVHLESVLGEGTRVIVRLPRIGRGEEAPHPGQP